MRTGTQRRPVMGREAAAELAVEALLFIAAEASRLARFLNLSGYRPEDIRAQASSDEFLAGVLDFLLEDESLLLVFASHSGRDPAQAAAARRALSPAGGAD